MNKLGVLIRVLLSNHDRHCIGLHAHSLHLEDSIYMINLDQISF